MKNKRTILKMRNLTISFLIFAVMVMSFLPVLKSDFILFDDDKYVTKNPVVRSGLTVQGIFWAFSHFHAANWHPITWLSHMADVDLFGIEPRGHHLTSLVIHAINAFLLFLALSIMTGSQWRSATVTALFALHPLRVESVAWISERKDVLSAGLGLITILFYVWYTRKPSITRYIPIFVSLALGLMAKPMLITMPFLLLFLDWWPLGRTRPILHPVDPPWPMLVREKIPLCVLSTVSTIVTVKAQEAGEAFTSFQSLSLAARLLNALVSYASYVVKTLWPHSLAVFYPLPEAGHPAWKIVLSGLLVAGASLLAIRQKIHAPWLLTGWFFYVTAILPVIGIIQIGSQAMADRYTYIPSIGLAIIAVWAIPNHFLRGGVRGLTIGVVLGIILILSILTYFQGGYWHDSKTLFKRTLAVTDGNWLIHDNLGMVLHLEGELDGAIKEYSEALRIRPDQESVHNNLGLLLAEKGRNDEARQHYEAALRLKPDNVPSYVNLGNISIKEGRIGEAERFYRTAIRFDPGSPEANNGLGSALISQQRHEEAITYLSAALRSRPDYANAHYNMAIALAVLGKESEAKSHVDAAMRLERAQEAFFEAGSLRRYMGLPPSATAAVK